MHKSKLKWGDTITSALNKTLFKRAITFLIVAVIITIIAMIITYIVSPDPKEVNAAISGKASDGLNESTGLKKVWAFIVNNGFLVPLQMFMLALIPIQFLYYINIIFTAALPGILFGLILQFDNKIVPELIISALPYYAVEVFAFCLLAAILFELNQVIRFKIKSIFRKSKEKESIFNKVLETIIVYVVLTLPLMIIAAFFETYLADFILGLF